MSMMIVATNKDIKPWIQSFKEYNPNINIQIYPNITDKDTITFALVWSKNEIDFTQFKNLKCIASMGAGVDHILCNKTISRDIAITKIVDTQLVSSMWEYLLTVVMNVVTNHYNYISQQKHTIWNPIEPVKSIRNKTITILGLGQLGNTIAQNFANMNFKVKGYSRTKKEIKNVATYTTLEESINDSDIIINLLPLTKETQQILNNNFFEKLKTGAYIINAGRGEHLVVDDLIQAIKEQKISGATLDVFEIEPLPKDNPLWENEKITITPHSASITNPVSVTKQIMENYSIIQKGRLPLNIVDTTKGY